MIIREEIRIVLVILVMSFFLFQSCSTIILEASRGISKTIPITSNTPDTKIIVDGELVGFTPMNFKPRKKSHVILIEKQGYSPFEIRITRKISPLLAMSIVGNLFWGYLGSILGLVILDIIKPSGDYFDNPDARKSIFARVSGAILCWSGATLVDFLSGANYTLSPKELSVTLTKIGEKPQSNIILIDEEHFRNIKWIRIKCADSVGEDEIVTLD